MCKLDITNFKRKVFLNKSLISKSLVESFRSKQKNASSESEIILRIGDLAELYKNLALSDSKDKPLSKTVYGLLDRSRQGITDLNIIPIGIVNVDAILLTKLHIKILFHIILCKHLKINILRTKLYFY